MGIYDRDYLRSPGPRRSATSRGPGQASPRGLRSVNTWLILICVAVYLLGLGLEEAGLKRWAPTGSILLVQGLPSLNDVDYEISSTVELAPGNLGYGHPIIERQTRQVLGYQLVLGNRPVNPLMEWGHFSTSRGFLGFEFWRFIGFQFLHFDFNHLLFNMIGLFFFGSIVEAYLGGKRYLAFYILCGMFGAILYLFLNLGGYIVDLLWPGFNVPGLLFYSTDTPLIGASAGVFGVLLAGAFLAPKVTVLLFFIIPMKLAQLAWGLVILSIVWVLLGKGNAGGEAAHLGGAAAGFYFIRRPHLLHGFFDILGRVDPTSRSRLDRTVDRAKIDRVLDKISREGVHALTSKEKRLLHEASDRRRDNT
ncbi:MAG: rhomboid family intramembrane serine protease [Phycisphaerales bacterium]|nr:rhomboid family intramembrane serine protease [Phycisphaerales bacterium]